MTVGCTYDFYHVEGIDGTGFAYTTDLYVENVAIKAGGPLKEVKSGTYSLELNVNGDNETAYSFCCLKTVGNYQPVSFTSSKPAVATVDDAGVVYAKGKGSANITAKVNGKKIAVKVNVGE